MAVQKVFISSTCFDLSEIREQLKAFVSSFGFDPVLSEHGDVFYHPDLHTHDACVHEVSNCQLFILIIGGRFGGNYLKDKSKSITNAEYEAARSSKIPVFTYIRKGVLDNHHLYKENKSKEFVNEITYPAIDKQEDSANIFKFIDSVKRSPTNNAFEGFDSFNDIDQHLRKQWAGMFFDFLKTREVKSQIEATNHLIKGLESSNLKLEELVKSLYISSAKDSSKAEKSISEIEITNNIRKFFGEIIDVDGNLPIDINSLSEGRSMDANEISKISPRNISWYEYLLKTGLFEYNGENEDGSKFIVFHTGVYGIDVGGDKTGGLHKSLSESFDNGVALSTAEQRLSVIQEFME